MEGGPVEFRLLGAVEAWTVDGRLDLGPRKQRFVFAVLALRVNQIVPVDRLVDLTWQHAPPQTAHHAIHVRVSQLRAALAQDGANRGDAEIVTHGSAYVLRADPLRIDAHRFRALLGDARAETDDAGKVALFRRALDTWRGPPLADVATPEVADQLCRGLEEARLAALEECLDAELRLGRHGAVIDELTESTAQHPYRQRLLAQLMLALYRAGRAPDALSVYRGARSRLVDELGLDPEPQLTRLEKAIICADPALELPRQRRDGALLHAVPAPAPSDPTPSDPTPSDPTPSDPTPSDPTPPDPTPPDPTSAPALERAGPESSQASPVPRTAEYNGRRFAQHDLLRLHTAEHLSREDGQHDRAGVRSTLDSYLRGVDRAAQNLDRRLDGGGRSGTRPARADPPPAPLAWLNAERANLVAAIRHAAEHGPLPATWLLARALVSGWREGVVAMATVTVDAERLTKRFGARTAVDELSFTARQGEVVGLLGPNGAGKTTAIRLLTTVLAPTSGEFVVAGIPSSRPAEIRRRVGALPESAGYPGHQTGRDYLRYYARLFGLPRGDAARMADRLLTDVGLTERASARISTYSRGMRQRLGIARALLNRPAVVLLDEPTLGLDPAGQRHVLGIVRDIAFRTGATVVLSTHALPEVEEVCTTVLILDRGKVVVSGSVGEVTRAVTARRTGRLRVPVESVGRASEALVGVPGVTVGAADDQPDMLRITLTGEPAGRPGRADTVLNVALQAVLSAGIPVLSFDVEGARLTDAFLAMTGEGAR
jgi:ABC-2 type transport system ATP-binding protein